MIRIALSVMLLVHGLIHLLGFFRAFGLAGAGSLAGKSLLPFSPEATRWLGMLWLTGCALFLGAALLLLLRKDWWWAVSIPAVVLSQALILLYWPEAKFGTVANVIALLGILLAYGPYQFNRMTQREVQSLLPKTLPGGKVVNPQMLAGLPSPVQGWLRRSGVVGKECIHTVHLKQQGEMRTHPVGKWMPFTAQQYVTVDQPGFVWVADVEAAPLVHLAGRDKYEAGRGYLLIKLLSLIPVARAEGRQIDQGTLLRYLAEIVWYPSAALSDYISWQQIDATRALATMRYGGISASGVFTFNGAGDVASFSAKRYYDRKEGPTLEDWLVAVEPAGYREFDGIRIPARSTVTWRLKEGDFTWYKLRIVGITYNQDKREMPQDQVLPSLSAVHQPL
jgi:hypothetical protein